MRTGWIKEAEGWYYGDNTSSTGWKYINGAWYYLDGANAEYPGLMLENCRQAIGGATYFFRTSGAMYTGWVQMPEGWYYTTGSGAMATGWQSVGGTWYYLDGANEEQSGPDGVGRQAGHRGSHLLLPAVRRDVHRLGIKAGGMVLCVRERRHGDRLAEAWEKTGIIWIPRTRRIQALWYLTARWRSADSRIIFNADGAMRAGWIKEADGEAGIIMIHTAVRSKPAGSLSAASGTIWIRMTAGKC